MGAAELHVYDSIARVAAAVESEGKLSHAVWAEDHARMGPCVPTVQVLHNEAVGLVRPGDIEAWQSCMDAVLGTVDEVMDAIA